ncbi:serine hydrolase [Clostridiaceae bacterium M8S5]|nr:serine hydrolase [Clostridiaceae bacterium M8S5]
MRRIITRLIIFGIIINLILPSTTVLADGDSNTTYELTQEQKEKIDKFIQENMDKGKIPGLSITIVRGPETIYQKCYGYSDIEKKKLVTNKTLFELGSTSKAFTALGILQLELDGLINIDDKVSKYIPWFEVNYEGENAEITIEQLLHHSSGIPFNTIDKIPASIEDNALEQTVKTLVKIKLDSKPGEKFRYATINYDVLGLIIQTVTGQSYEKYMEENILKPLDLRNTYLFKEDSNIKDMAIGYKIGFLKPRRYDAPEYRGNKPAGYILSSGEDMAKWLKIQMGATKESKFSNSLIEISHKPNRTIPPTTYGSSYAAGWQVFQAIGGRISHGGANPNYSSFITFKPDQKEGIAVLANSNSEYVEFICTGVSGIINDNSYYKNRNIKDLNKRADRVSVFIVGFSSLIIISILYFFGKSIKEIIKKERIFKSISIKSLIKVCISLIFVLGVTYCLYLIPYILYAGVSWSFVFVWLPNTTKIALYFFTTCIWVVYIYVLCIILFKKR